MTNKIIKIQYLLALLALCLVVFAGAPRVVNAQSTSDNMAGQSDGIVPIGPADPLSVSVIGEPDLTNTYTVDPDGNIEMPYIGKVHVGGLTPDEAGSLLQQKLSQIYTSPQVTVTRTGLGGIEVTVTGAVNKQGNEGLRRDANLNDAVQLAAPTPDADLKHIEVTHGLPGMRHTTETFDLASFLNDGTVDGDPPLHDGDTIFIPKNTASLISISVTGEVLKPGRYPVPPGATVFDAITDAGGLSPDADPEATYMQAMGSTTQQPFNYTTASQNPSNTQLNPVLQDGDEVVVPAATDLPTYAITGGVLKPGDYPLKGVVSLLDAISTAGGLENYAKAKNCKITRTTPHGPIVIAVDASDTRAAATTYLQSGDNITIPHGSPPRSVSPFDLLGAVGSVFGLLRL